MIGIAGRVSSTPTSSLLRSLLVRSGNTTAPSVTRGRRSSPSTSRARSRSSEPPQGAAALSVLVTRRHAAIGRLQVETGGRRPSDRLLREMLIDELGVRVLEEHATREHDDICQEVLSGLTESFRR